MLDFIFFRHVRLKISPLIRLSATFTLANLILVGSCFDVTAQNGCPSSYEFRKLKKEAEDRLAEAMFTLGNLHSDNKCGYFNRKLAIRWKRRLATLYNNSFAMVDLGNLYHEIYMEEFSKKIKNYQDSTWSEEKEVLKKNPQLRNMYCTYIKWHIRAADLGSELALSTAHRAYFNGICVKRDAVISAKYFIKDLEVDSKFWQFDRNYCEKYGKYIPKDVFSIAKVIMRKNGYYLGSTDGQCDKKIVLAFRKYNLDNLENERRSYCDSLSSKERKRDKACKCGGRLRNCYPKIKDFQEFDGMPPPPF